MSDQFYDNVPLRNAATHHTNSLHHAAGPSAIRRGPARCSAPRPQISDFVSPGPPATSLNLVRLHTVGAWLHGTALARSW